MASVIKAGRVIPSGTAVQHTEFNLEDISQNATKYLDTVKQKAARIIKQAEEQSQLLLVQAAQKGIRAAEDAAKQAALVDMEERWRTLAPALQQAIDSTVQLRASWIRQWEDNVIRLVVAVSQRVIRRELAQQPEISKQWIRESLELASGSASITLHLNPNDYEALETQRERLEHEFSQLATANIVADPDITPGGCRVATEYGLIDQQVEAQLARIEQELTS